MNAIDTMICNAENIKEEIIEVLRFRGFLIDAVSDGYVLSDNSCLPYDEEYLSKLLKANNWGTIRERQILLNENVSVEGVVQGIENIGRIGRSAYFPREIDWEHFSRNDYGLKVPVEILELYVARYIKAISACGVSTWCSCDGNHSGKKGLYIGYCGPGDRVWHNLLFDKLLANRFDIIRDDSGQYILFKKRRKQGVFLLVNWAAAFLYEYREKLRQIKKEAFAGKTSSYFRHTPVDIIESEFIEKAGKLLETIKHEIYAEEEKKCLSE